MKPALVVLAAGASERLGTCKALVDLGGRTPLERLLASGACADGAPPLVVTGAHHVRIARALPGGAEALENPGWRAGRTGGVALAAAARPGLDLVLAPVDVPLVPAEVFELLLDEWQRAGAPARGWLGPFTERPAAGELPAGGERAARDEPSPGERALGFGHPILVGRDLLLDLVRDRKDFPARPTANSIHTLRDLRRCAELVLAAHTPSARILDDLDTEADLERLRRVLS
jgi:CTP:molybdopterin cytidylyltransferase MocA